MHSNDWRPCIITVIDLIGMRDAAVTGRASSKMLEMHRFVVSYVDAGLSNHSCGYVWNDSVMMLSYRTKPKRALHDILCELSEFKRALEDHCGVRTYAISVMGLAFPQQYPPSLNVESQSKRRVVVLKTSSWAMANCLLIEKALKRRRADWYIDSRIARGAGLRKPVADERVALLPKNRARTIYMYKGYFHAGC
jgi:hypothetical protein